MITETITIETTNTEAMMTEATKTEAMKTEATGSGGARGREISRTPGVTTDPDRGPAWTDPGS